MTDEEAAVKVTLPVIYTTLLDVKDKVERVADSVEDHTGRLHDHEVRIRVLEARVWQAAGACSILGILAGVFASRIV